MVGTTTVGLKNATAGMTNGFGDATPLLPLVLVVILGAVAVASSARLYRQLLRTRWGLRRAADLALKGVLTAIPLVAVALPAYVFVNADAQTQGLALRALGAMVALVGGLVVLGYAGEQLWTLIKQRHIEATGREPFAGWRESADGGAAD
jgi:hypothetical protein